MLKQPIVSTRVRFSLIIACVICTFLLTACVTGGNAPKAAKVQPTPTPLPLTTYQGDGYTIGYPQGWQEKGNGSLVTFTDAQGLMSFIVEETPNPNGTIPPTTAIDGGLNGLKGQGVNFQKIEVSPTLTIGGNTWNQGAATADTNSNGQTTNLKLVVLSSNYPQHAATTRTFTLIYSTPTRAFEQANMQQFQPMLQSFKFA